jgi:dimethylhistidine N-methyltransferase
MVLSITSPYRRLFPWADTPATVFDYAPAEFDFRGGVLAGLLQASKSIPRRFLFDDQGCALFEAICAIPEYHISALETRLIESRAREIGTLIGPRAQIVEFSDCAKGTTDRLLSALVDPAAYLLVSLSRSAVRQSALRIAAKYPGLDVTAIGADYVAPGNWWIPRTPGPRKRLAVLPGHIVSHLAPDSLAALLRRLRTAMAVGDGIVAGVDIGKDWGRLEKAYNDAAGLTAAFVLNLLVRANRTLSATFALHRFRHRASYNPVANRVEVSIQSAMDQLVCVANRQIPFTAHEHILVQYAHRHSADGFEGLATAAGFKPMRCWTDGSRRFALVYLSAA